MWIIWCCYWHVEILWIEKTILEASVYLFVFSLSFLTQQINRRKSTVIDGLLLFFFSLYFSMIYSSSQTNKEPIYMLETYACMFFPFSSTVQVLPLLIHRATYLLTVRHTFQMCSSFEQSMEKKFFSCILETTDFFLCSSNSKSYGNMWAKWINGFTFTA